MRSGLKVWNLIFFPQNLSPLTVNERCKSEIIHIQCKGVNQCKLFIVQHQGFPIKAVFEREGLQSLKLCAAAELQPGL